MSPSCGRSVCSITEVYQGWRAREVEIFITPPHPQRSSFYVPDPNPDLQHNIWMEIKISTSCRRCLLATRTTQEQEISCKAFVSLLGSRRAFYRRSRSSSLPP